jgi:hypothetical protein
MRRVLALATMLLGIAGAIAVTGCGANPASVSQPPMASPSAAGTLQTYQNASPPYTVSVPAFMIGNPPGAPKFLDGGGSILESRMVFGATPADQPRLHGSVYLFIIARAWGFTARDRATIVSAGNSLFENLTKGMTAMGGQTSTGPIEAKYNGPPGHLGVYERFPGTDLAYVSAVFPTTNRAYILVYRFSDEADATKLMSVCKQTFSSFAPGTPSKATSASPSAVLASPGASASPATEKDQIETYLAGVKRIVEDRDAPNPGAVGRALNALPASPSAAWGKVQKSFRKLATAYDTASIDLAAMPVPASMAKANRLGVRHLRLMYEVAADATILLRDKQGPRGPQWKLWVPVEAKRKVAVEALRQWAFETRVVAKKYGAKDPMHW